MSKPNLFIIGKPKTGTTALYYFLNEHPEIFMCDVKEPRHFCTDTNLEIRNYQQKCLDPDTYDKYCSWSKKYENQEDYLKLFEKVSDEKLIGEASTAYIGSAVAAEEIYRFNPESKIIVMFREPTSYLVSSFHQNKRMQNEDAKSFKEAIELENERRQGRRLPKNISYPPRVFYSEKLNYCTELQRFLKYFPNEQIRVVIFEDFVKDNQKIFSEIAAFLNIDSEFIPTFSEHNVWKDERFGKIKSMIDALDLGEKLKKQSMTLYHALKKLYYFFFMKTVKKPEIDPELRQKLKRRYKNEVVQFNTLLHKQGFIANDRDLIKIWGYHNIEIN